ncbi:MAG: hypothetical protein EON47_12870 [Acetobacteraceae bacterium]|nr:MAG: hypothetical protein EON47_12870 [Acetobacteraceae bacterium]
MSTTTIAAAPPVPKVETPLQRFVSEFCASRIAMLGLLVFIAIVLIAVLAPWIAPPTVPGSIRPSMMSSWARS